MKAEINESGILELHPETKEESEKVYYWAQKNNARIVIPEGRLELAVHRFNSLDIAVFVEPNYSVSNRFHEGAKPFESNIPGV